MISVKMNIGILAELSMFWPRQRNKYGVFGQNTYNDTSWDKCVDVTEIN